MLSKPMFRSLLLCAAILPAVSCRPYEAPYTDEAAREVNQWLDSRRTAPAALIAEETAAGRRAVLIQQEALRGDTVQLMRSLLPVIHNLGIDTLGVFFLDGAEQEAIDRYVVTGDESLKPEELLIAADASLGYREYRDFIVYVSDYNRRAEGESDFIRLTGLSGEGADEADFLWIRADEAGELVSADAVSADAVSADDDERSSVILMHYGPGSGGPRLDALVEDLRGYRAVRDLTFAFRPGRVSWAEAGDFPDTDIVMVTSFPYTGVEAIPDFITDENLEAAAASFSEYPHRGITAEPYY